LLGCPQSIADVGGDGDKDDPARGVLARHRVAEHRQRRPRQNVDRRRWHGRHQLLQVAPHRRKTENSKRVEIF
jgi:hypothetical protein